MFTPYRFYKVPRFWQVVRVRVSAELQPCALEAQCTEPGRVDMRSQITSGHIDTPIEALSRSCIELQRVLAAIAWGAALSCKRLVRYWLEMIRRSQNWHSASRKQIMGFLVSGYRTEVEWWEARMLLHALAESTFCMFADGLYTNPDAFKAWFKQHQNFAYLGNLVLEKPIPTRKCISYLL